jgi:hypothetical protein
MQLLRNYKDCPPVPVAPESKAFLDSQEVTLIMRLYLFGPLNLKMKR